MNTQVEVAKASGYALVKYASQQYPTMNFKVCSRMCKGGVLRVWIENDGNQVVGDVQEFENDDDQSRYF